MSDFQKLTLKRYGRNFLIVCGFGLLVYGMIKSALVLYATVAIMVLTIVGACVWSMVDSVRWDWRLRGKLTEDEYKAYQSCERMFGWRDDKSTCRLATKLYGWLKTLTIPVIHYGVCSTN